MKEKAGKGFPEIVIRNGKPTAVILDINQYEEILERLEDLKDLKILQGMKKKPLKFKRVEEFLREHRLSV